ncbi:MAG: hypothetical protein JOY71_05500 [Acetobacteraceae bacterium]|nr:hypothetical protein [Acetobacteraceae bacterium]
MTRSRALRPDDAEAQRARRATANGILTMLKAALNLAYRERPGSPRRRLAAG